MGTSRKVVLAVAATALVGAAGAGVAQASQTSPAKHSSAHTASAAADTSGPSSCRPANHKGRITPDAGSAGHHHYRVTLTAAPGTSSCKLAGSPSDVKFYLNGSVRGVTAKPYGTQGKTVTFGPGHPVHFDIQVPSSSAGAKADDAEFTLQAPGGEIPGKSGASGSLSVDAGTQIGPVQAGS